MRRWVWRALGVVVALPVLLVAGVFAVFNTGAGQRAVPGLVARLAGPGVSVAGFAGRFPDDLRLSSLTLSDAQGVWATAKDIRLDWAPSRLLGRVAHIDLASVGWVDVARLPVSAGPAAPSSGRPFSLPLRVEVARLALPAVALGAPVAGTPVALAAEGSVSGTSLTDAAVDVTARTADGGTYAVAGTVADVVRATLRVAEPGGGLIARLAGLPDLGAIAASVDADGVWGRLPFTADVTAGGLAASARGTADLTARAGSVTLDAAAPAMAPAPGMAWRSVAIHATADGTLAAPRGAGHVTIQGFSGGGAAADEIAADVTSDRVTAALRGTVAGLRLPGPNPGVLADAPVAIEGTFGFATPNRGVAKIAHPLLTLTAEGRVAERAGTADIALRDLSAFGPVAGTAAAHVVAAPREGGTGVVADGTLGLTAGPGPSAALLGDAATFHADVVLGDAVRIAQATVAGAHATLAAHGDAGSALDVFAHATVEDLALIQPTLRGAVALDAHVAGPADDFAADATLTGQVSGGATLRGETLRVIAHATGLPDRPDATISASGMLDGAPVTLDAHAARADGGFAATLTKLAWRSVSGSGHATLAPGASVPVGDVALAVGKLADLRAFAGAALTGGVDLQASSDGHSVRAKLAARKAGIEGSTVTRADVVATATGLDASPSVDATATLDGIAARGVSGRATLTAKGPQAALAVGVTSALQVRGVATPLSARAVLDVPASVARVSALTAGYRGETLRLAAPVRVTWAPEVAVDRLRLLWRQAAVEVAGTLSPALDATARVRGVDFAALRGLVPEPPLSGTLEADATLRGKPASPDGTVRLAVRGLRVLTGAGRAVPPANLDANATLAGGRATLTARAAAGAKVDLTVNGSAPLGAGALDLRAAGRVDLALLDPVLSAQGRSVKGALALDAGVRGTVAAPDLSGSATLAGGEVRDVGTGLDLTAIAGRFGLAGQTVTIDGLRATAGPGSITVAGTVGALAPGLPADLTVTARGARPLASDRVTAVLDSDLRLRGATGTRALSGTVSVTRADIRLPERLPVQVATLNVRRPGDKPPVAAAPAEAVALDLGVRAAQVFVRGRGLDAEVGGDLKIGGTTLAPVPRGAFTLRRGDFSVAGQTLTFSKGEVSFDGGSLANPSIDFEAASAQASSVSTLAITGTASDPKITLSAVPDAPQDEILARILFGQSVSQLSPFQIAQIAATLAQLTGAAPGGGLLADPLGRVRSGLGLDRLSVGGGSGGSASPTIEAGRYIAPGVFLGARQGTGGGTQATVQVDLYRGLKLESAVGAGGGAGGQTTATGSAAAQGNGSSVGLTYQFEY